jgi:hypothetical protein
MLEVTDANAREAAAAAERLLRDPFLAEALDEMVANATERAITAPRRSERREARHEVLAIQRLRVNLHAVMEHWRDAARVLRQAKAHE